MSIRAFVSDHPDILAVYREAVELDEKWRLRMNAAEARFGRRIYGRRGFKGYRESTGLEATDEAPPEGWVQLKSLNYLTPNKRTKAGKAEQAWLASLDGVDLLGMLKPFGLPRNSMEATSSWLDGRIYSPAVAEYCGRVFVTWDEAVSWEGSDYFKPIKLSEYYADKEAAEVQS